VFLVQLPSFFVDAAKNLYSSLRLNDLGLNFQMELFLSGKKHLDFEKIAL